MFCGQRTKVSSTHLTHILVAALRTLFSNSSMYRLVIMGKRGKPIAVPLTCSKNASWNWKYVDRRHISVSWQISGTVMVVRFSRDSTCVRREWTVCIASWIQGFLQSTAQRRSATLPPSSINDLYLLIFRYVQH